MKSRPFILGPIFLLVAFLFSCSTVVSNSAEESEADDSEYVEDLDGEGVLFAKGSGMATYECQGAYAGKTVDIYYYIPSGDVREMPVQIVMHGMDRNGDKYRDDWKKLANQYGFVVLAPQFSEDDFSEDAYQRGNVKGKSGAFVPRDSMTYPIISEVFHFFLDNSVSRATKFNIYGHSAGAQFVHRYLLFNDTREVNRAVAANAGWYTFPTDSLDYPYGIGRSVEEIGIDVDAYYKKSLTILLGEADTLRTESLNTSAKADAQGRTRLERGDTFFEFCEADAESRGVPFRWERAYVPGVGHSDAKMAPEAARILYGE